MFKELRRVVEGKIDDKVAAVVAHLEWLEADPAPQERWPSAWKQRKQENVVKFHAPAANVARESAQSVQ